MLLDEDPELALQHARYARRRASRIAVVREAAGIAAYHAGEWSEALGELRAARRMGGGPGHIAVMADIERALGRPERALELARGPEVAELGPAEQIELAIVSAGARRDLGELDAAVVGLQISALDPRRRDPWSARLFYAYADNLLAAGRESDALQWFVHAADADADAETDAAVRIAELTGEPLPEEDVIFGEDEVPDEPAAPADEATNAAADVEEDADAAEAGATGDSAAEEGADADVEDADVTDDSDAGADALEDGAGAENADATADSDAGAETDTLAVGAEAENADAQSDTDAEEDEEDSEGRAAAGADPGAGGAQTSGNAAEAEPADTPAPDSTASRPGGDAPSAKDGSDS
ncbi:hypothetical protein [Pseudonocardia acidicola]|uniref:hypothetical protein n=1 Tax=Pseudonocardia acidicola TaxID=2724939 RepID=UPI001EEFC862|nr:hypothetical protein [Pseudonocardia acidicola]